MDVSLIAALIGGTLTLLSPCSVMLLPAFFSYAFTSPGKLIARTGVFYLGLVTTLVPWGILAGSLGAFLNRNRDQFIRVAGIVVIILGLIMVLNLPIPFLTQPQGATNVDGSGTGAVYVLGMVYGVAGVCAGPLLGAVLTFASTTANALHGGIVLLVFGLGMVVPLLLLALLWDAVPAIKKALRPRSITIGRWHTTWNMLISGMLTVGIGIAMIWTNGFQTVAGVLDTATHAQLENAVFAWGNAIPDWVMVVAALAVVAISWGAYWWRKRRRTQTQVGVGATLNS